MFSNKSFTTLSCAIVFLLTAVSSSAAAEQIIFDEKSADRWQAHSFDDGVKPTSYEWIEDDTSPYPGKVLKAVASSSASGYILQEPIKFTESLKLKITYKIIKAEASSVDERSKEGDDFPVRLYVSEQSDIFYKTLIMVHSLQQKKNTAWESVYSSFFAKWECFVFAGTETNLDQWVNVEIDIGKVWHDAYGEFPDQLDFIALMVDTDNTGRNFTTQIARISYQY